MSKALKKLIDINRLREFKNKLVGAGSAYVQTGAVDQTIAGTKTFSKPIVGSLTGNAATATKATKDSAGQQIDTTYIKGLAVSGRTITYTKGDGTTGTITTQDTNTWTAFKGATSSANGTAGYVPAPTKGNQNKFFKADGTWATPPNTTYASMSASEATTGTATAARTISAKVLHDKINSNLSAYATKTELNKGLTTKANDSEVVHKSGDETIAGTKTFSKPIVGSVTGSSGSCTGNAATATKATQDAAGNTITTTYATKAHTHTKSQITDFPALATVATSGSYTDLANKPAIPTVNNATLTIQKNGTTVKTFTANASANVTANITVPTKVSELTNDSGFLTSHQSLSNYVTLNGAQTISGAKTFTGNIIGINKERSTEDANSLYSATAGSKLTYYTISNSGTTLTNVPATVNTILESRTIRRLSDSDWIVEQICHNSKGLYYRKGSNGTWGAWKTFAFTDSNISGNAATATTATTAQACTGNAATATKLATKRTIALSGAATGTATGFDGSGNITIPVTALSPSAIRAQWYAAYPDGAEAHNAMWGGRDITAAFNAGTVSANIANGTFKDIFPGDYITKQVTISGTAYTVNWVIADCDYWWHKGDKNNNIETHHVAIVPQQPIFDARMNATNTTEGGYKGSEMYRSVISACATGIVNAFGPDHILTIRDGISNSVDTSHVSSGIPQYTGTPGWWGEWVSVQCNLMSEKMVFGAPVCSAGAMDNTMATRQMSAFRLSEKLINYNRNWWWLRDVASSAGFTLVDGTGFTTTAPASFVCGVRPFALLV